jgi:hypothetical protein
VRLHKRKGMLYLSFFDGNVEEFGNGAGHHLSLVSSESDLANVALFSTALESIRRVIK